MKEKRNSSISRAEVAQEKQNKDKRTKNGKLHSLLRWWPVPVYILLVVVLIIFIKGGDENDLYKAKYNGSTDRILLGDTEYTLLSEEEQDSYIGSFVSDKLNAVKKDKVASMRSYLLYVGVYFSAEGDDNLDYLIDGKNNIFVKSELYEGAEKYFADSSNISEYKMTAKLKDLETMNTLTDEQMNMLRELSGEEIIVKDITVTENYETRREIYGFYDDGIFYKACMELFLYNNEVYKTTMMIDGNDNEGVSVLRGIKLPKEYQDEFKAIWD